MSDDHTPKERRANSMGIAIGIAIGAGIGVAIGLAMGKSKPDR